MRLLIFERHDEMLRRDAAVQAGGYEAGVEAIGEGFAWGGEGGFDH